MNFELFDENENSLLSGTNMDGGYLNLNWTNDDFGRFLYFKVSGANNESWYDLEVNIMNEGDSKNGDNNPFANFDLSSIPGFPFEIVGTTFIISTIALILFVKKKKR